MRILTENEIESLSKGNKRILTFLSTVQKHKNKFRAIAVLKRKAIRENFCSYTVKMCARGIQLACY